MLHPGIVTRARSEPPGRYAGSVPPARLIALVAVAVPAFVAAAILLPHSPSALRELVLSVGPAAPLIAIAAWTLLTPALFPGTVLAAAGGLAFGAPAGSALAIGGAIGGGLAAFALARTAARAPLQRLVQRKPRLARVNALLERRGFAAILTARLTPGVPAGWLHYAAGVSPVRATTFAAAIAVGAVLRTAPYAVLGQGLGSGSTATVLLAAGSIGVGGIVAALLVRHLRRPAAIA
jgi:uncharacterized membrane protein YdjX (TVP38/TMEM64 family)